VLRRNPVRAQEVRATRHAKLVTLQALVAKHNHYLADHLRANAQRRAEARGPRQTLRIADWVELTVAGAHYYTDGPGCADRSANSMAVMC